MSAEEPLVSIVVPVHNTGDYLRDCLDSLVAQTYRNIEILAVNDGSFDHSAAIIAEYEARDPRVRGVARENGGLSRARMTGLAQARGKYIAFLDSDDWWDARAVSAAIDFGETSRSDYVLFSARIFDEARDTSYPFYDDDTWEAIAGGRRRIVTNFSEEPRLMLLEPQSGVRVFRREFFLNAELEYPPGLLYEDFPVHCRALTRARRVGLLRARYFNYRVGRPGKLTDRKDAKRLDVLEVTNIALDHLLPAQLTDAQGVNFVRAALRLIWWCESHTPDQHLPAFREEFAGVARRLPETWLSAFRREASDTPGVHLQLWLLKRGLLNDYARLRSTRRPSVGAVRGAIELGYTRTAAKVVIAKLGSLVRRG